MKPLTDKQKKILDYIAEFISRHGYPPTVREIGAAVGLSSSSTVHSHLSTLERAGFISRDTNKTRAISLTNGLLDGVPILGTVAAGEPILAVEDALGHIPYNAGERGEYFALRIKGDSMIEAGILAGDMVVVRSQPTANHGEIVIAMLGDEATCKRLHIEERQIWLLPENEIYEPIDGTGAVILGKVTAVIRTY